MDTESLPGIQSKRLLQTFLEMVRIDSPSGDEAEMRAYLVQQIQRYQLAYRVDTGGNLIVDIPANRCEHAQILVLSGHMDVVPPCHNIQPVVETIDGDQLISSDNTTVLGADDKAGLAPILEAVFHSLENNLPRPHVRLLLTTREETCLGGAKDLDEEALKAAFALTFDHTGRQGIIIHQAPTYLEFEILCYGKSVHAGIMPEQGVNAIVFAAKVIEKLHLGRIDAETTANIGFWDGGKATNIVPDLATLRGELRGHNRATLEQELAHIQRVLTEVSSTMPGTRFEFRHTPQFEGYSLDPQHAGLQLVAKAIQSIGLEPQLVRTNGGSDNNVFVARGLPGIVLSAGYMEPHSLKERVKLSEMILCTQLILKLMETFAHDRF